MLNLDAARLFSAKGLVAVVTGTNSRLDEVIAHALEVNSAGKVFILGSRGETQGSCIANNGSLVPIVCDVTSKASFQAAAPAIQNQTPSINLLIANSGYQI